MCKKIILMLFVLLCLQFFGACDKFKNVNRGGIIIGEDKKSDEKLEQIISAIKDKDKEALKSLFSKKALDEANNFDKDVEYLFEILQGEIDSWESDGWSSDESIRSGKKSLMIRFGFSIKIDKDYYEFFVIDYNTDTINPDNQGIYMLELIKFAQIKDLEAWQDRMRAGIYIH